MNTEEALSLVIVGREGETAYQKLFSACFMARVFMGVRPSEDEGAWPHYRMKMAVIDRLNEAISSVSGDINLGLSELNSEEFATLQSILFGGDGE